MSKLLSNETFIQKSIMKHGLLYNYSDVVYLGTKTKVKIICNTWRICSNTK